MGGYDMTRVWLVLAIVSAMWLSQLTNVEMGFCDIGGDSNDIQKVERRNSIKIMRHRLAKEMRNRRLLLEKYFLLVQKRKFQKLPDTNPRVAAFKKIIDLQLRVINHALERRVRLRLHRKFVHLLPRP